MTTVLDLISTRSVTQIYSRFLEIAAGENLPVTNWRDESPSRILFYGLARLVGEVVEPFRVSLARSAFITTAKGAWQRLVASEVYGTEYVAATYATPTVTVTNTGRRTYTPEPGDLVFSSSTTGATYHNTSDHREPAVQLAPGTTITIELIADAAGSDSSAGVDEIDTIVTPMTGVAIVSSTAAYAEDDQSEASLAAAGLDKLGTLSDAGPPDAFTTAAIGASVEITRATSVPDSDYGVHYVYVGGPSGAVSSEALAAALAAIEDDACPLCTTPQVANGTPWAVDVAIAVSGANLPAGLATAAQDDIEAAIRALRGGDVLTVDDLRLIIMELASGAESRIGGGASRVSIVVAEPTSDITPDPDELTIPGTVVVGVVA